MELQDYLHVINVRKWILIQAVVIILAAALVASYLQKPVYQAESTVLVKEEEVGSGLFGDLLPSLSSQPERNLQTQVQLIKLRPIMSSTIKELGLKITPGELANRITVTPEGQTNLIHLNVNAASPVEAKKIADTLAQKFIEWNRTSKRKDLKEAREEVFYKLKDTEEDLLLIANKIDTQPADKKSQRLDAQWEMATGLYVMLSEKYEQLRINEAMETGGAEIVSAAVVPTNPIKPKPFQNGILALAVGLVFGTGLAFLIEYLDNTIKTPEDIEKYFELPLLAQIPKTDFPKKDQRIVVSWAYPKSTVAEAYRTLRTSIQYLNFDRSIKSILITSSGPREGKTTTLANLAVTLAQAGIKVIVICSDLRRPNLHKMFHLDNNKGLTNVLTGKVKLKDALQEVENKNLKVLPSGPLPPNPSELLGSVKMKRLINKMEEISDVVLIDTPPILAVTDSAVLATFVDGIIFVTSSGQSNREAAKEVKKLFGQENSRLLGVVLNNVKPTKSYGTYYHFYYYAQDAAPTKTGKPKMSWKYKAAAIALVFVALSSGALVLDYFVRFGLIDTLMNIL